MFKIPKNEEQFHFISLRHFSSKKNKLNRKEEID